MRLVPRRAQFIDPRELGMCLQCGYDLAGLEGARCPECGEKIEPFDRFSRRKMLVVFVAGLGPGLLASAAIVAAARPLERFVRSMTTGAMEGRRPWWSLDAHMLVPPLGVYLHLAALAVVVFIAMLPKALRSGRRGREALDRWRDASWKNHMSIAVSSMVIMASVGLADWLAIELWTGVVSRSLAQP